MACTQTAPIDIPSLVDCDSISITSDISEGISITTPTSPLVVGSYDRPFNSILLSSSLEHKPRELLPGAHKAKNQRTRRPSVSLPLPEYSQSYSDAKSPASGKTTYLSSSAETRRSIRFAPPPPDLISVAKVSQSKVSPAITATASTPSVALTRTTSIRSDNSSGNRHSATTSSTTSAASNERRSRSGSISKLFSGFRRSSSENNQSQADNIMEWRQSVSSMRRSQSLKEDSSQYDEPVFEEWGKDVEGTGMDWVRKRREARARQAAEAAAMAL